MLRLGILGTVAAAVLSASLAAQACSDNTYRAHVVNGDGVPFAQSFDPVVGETTYTAPNENVFLAFDPALPSGTYYVHVTDDPLDGIDEVLSANDPMDRFVSVTNTGGVISLALPFSSHPGQTIFGKGLNGVGQSLRLAPFATPSFSACRFKVLFGNAWDLSNGPANPWLLLGGFDPVTAQCRVRSYSGFRIGDGSGSDVRGVVFEDADQDGVRDPGESGTANRTVRLATATTSVATTTDGNGAFVFTNVVAGAYTVELSVPSGSVATTPISQAIQICACGDVDVAAFGLAAECVPCNARTIGYWRNVHGLQKVQQHGLLATLPALHLVNTCGHWVAPGSLSSFKCYLQLANGWNMGYMLSAQLVAMHCNVAVGFVHPSCVVQDPCLGTLTVAQLMQRAVAALILDSYTPPCTANRWHQTLIKNALDRANDNRIWRHCH